MKMIEAWVARAYISPPDQEELIDIRIVCDIQTARKLMMSEIFRLKPLRFVYGNESVARPSQLEIILPSWFDKETKEVLLTKGNQLDIAKYKDFKEVEEALPSSTRYAVTKWLDSVLYSVTTYTNLVNLGWTNGQALSVLPNSLKVEIVLSGTIWDWNYNLNNIILREESSMVDIVSRISDILKKETSE